MERVCKGMLPNKATYKLKVNGFHLVGTLCSIKETRSLKKVDIYSKMFDIAFEESNEKELKGDVQVIFINGRMKELYKNSQYYEDLLSLSEYNADFKDYIDKKLKQKKIALKLRKKRFKEKASLHKWNYFVTQTFDSSKFENEEQFKRAYLTCLSHLATDYGWRYMGVWERGEKTNRLHFHGVFYIPNGNMKGFFKESKYFNPIRKRMEKSIINSFFAVRFGRNDFQSINNNLGGITDYIIKYIGKSEEKIVYSRHIDNCINVELSREDFCLGYKLSYVTKFIVYDDLVSDTILDFSFKRGEIGCNLKAP